MTIVARASISSGAPQQGGLTIADGDTVALSLASYVGVGTLLWEVYSYPDGFTEPTGWETASGRYYWQGSANAGLVPPVIDMTGAPWGKYLVRATANYDATNRDESLAVQILGPSGIEDVAPLETNQFDAVRLQEGSVQRLARKLGTAKAEHANVADYSHLVVAGDWTAAIQAAIDAASHVVMPAGTYLISDTIESTDKLVTGAGIGQTIIRKTADCVAWVQAGGELRDLTIDGASDGVNPTGTQDNLRVKGGTLSRAKLTRVASLNAGATAIRIYEGNSAILDSVAARLSGQHGIALSGRTNTNTTHAHGIDVRGNDGCGVWIQPSTVGNARSWLAGTVQNNGGCGCFVGSRDERLNLYLETNLGHGLARYTVGTIAADSATGTISTNVVFPECLEVHFPAGYDGGSVTITGTDLDGAALTDTIAVPAALPAVVLGKKTFEAGSLASITSTGAGTTGTATVRVPGYYAAASVADNAALGTVSESPINNGTVATETVYSVAFGATFAAAGVRVCGLDSAGRAVIATAATDLSDRVRFQNDSVTLDDLARRVALDAGGYTPCVASDIGKTVTGGSTGDTATLVGYDNTARVWYLSAVDAGDLFDEAESLTIGTGTGAGTTTGAAALASTETKIVSLEVVATVTPAGAGATATIYADQYREVGVETGALAEGCTGNLTAEGWTHIYADGDGKAESHQNYHSIWSNLLTAGTRIATQIMTARLLVTARRAMYQGRLTVEHIGDRLYEIACAGSSSAHTVRVTAATGDADDLTLDVVGTVDAVGVKRGGVDIRTPTVLVVEVTDNVNDFGTGVTGWSEAEVVILKNSSGGSKNITGFLAAGCVARRKTIIRSTGDNIVLTHNDGASNAANRTFTYSAGSLTLGSQDGCTLVYDSDYPAWRVVGIG